MEKLIFDEKNCNHYMYVHTFVGNALILILTINNTNK
jgi:hypothetical protein